MRYRQDELGPWLKARRIERDIRPERGAVELGVSLRTYKNIERGIREVSVRELVALCELLDVPIESALGMLPRSAAR